MVSILKKRTGQRRFFILFVLTHFYLLNIGWSAQAADDCLVLMQNKCISCHFETRICQKIKKNKGKRSWKRTIKSMVRHGTELSREEQKKLVQCFAGRDPAILDFCGMGK